MRKESLKVQEAPLRIQNGRGFLGVFCSIQKKVSIKWPDNGDFSNRFRGEFFNLVKSSEADWNRERDRDLLRSMMMTASDVSAITKPWEVQLKVGLIFTKIHTPQNRLSVTNDQ
jgi:hypothetical protein